MKRLIVMLMLVGVAAGPRRPVLQTPKDKAANGVRTHAVQPPVISASVMARLVPVPAQVVVIKHPPCWPNCTNSQLSKQWAGFSWQATNGRGFTTYLVLSTTNLNLGWQKAEQQVVPDGLWHTSGLPFDPSAPAKFYGLYRY